MAADPRITAYAEAMFSVARAEGSTDGVTDELFRFARSLESSDELREALTDPHIPASRRQQIVEDLLGRQASPTTIALISMAVGAGRARELPAIIDEVVRMSAARGQRVVAEVRSAVELSDDQCRRLGDALARATGKQVEVKVVVDPTVMGGLLVTMGDTVIDGTIRHRLEQLKNAF